MKILHIITSLRTGGAERIVADLCPCLQKIGDEISVLLLDGTRTSLYDQLEHAGIHIDSLSKGWRAMRNPFLLPRLLRYLKNNAFDIVHSHNTFCGRSLHIPSFDSRYHGAQHFKPSQRMEMVQAN